MLFPGVVYNVNKNPYYLRYASSPRVIYSFVESFQPKTFSLTSPEISRNVYEVYSWNSFRLLLPTYAKQCGFVTGFQKEQVFCTYCDFQWEEKKQAVRVTGVQSL